MTAGFAPLLNATPDCCPTPIIIASAIVERMPNQLPTSRIDRKRPRSEEHTSELQSLMRISYAVFCLKKKQLIPGHSRSTSDTRDTASTNVSRIRNTAKTHKEPTRRHTTTYVRSIKN